MFYIFCVFFFKFLYRASSYASAILAAISNSVCPSVCLSVRLSVLRVLCDKATQSTADMLMPHRREISLVFWHQQWLVGDAPFRRKFALKVTQPLRKQDSDKKFNYDEYKVDHGLSNEL